MVLKLFHYLSKHVFDNEPGGLLSKKKFVSDVKSDVLKQHVFLEGENQRFQHKFKKKLYYFIENDLFIK